MYDHCSVSNVPDLVSRLSACIDDLTKSYASHRLQLNLSKTEVIWFGIRSTLSKIPLQYHSLTVCNSSVHCCDVVRDLGVYLDSELQIKRHVNKVVSLCYCHLRNLVSKQVMTQLVTVLILSRVDYCNSLLIDVPASTIAPLQRVQNTAARLVLGLDCRSHITPALYVKLHWLPVRFRIIFKVGLAVTMHHVFHQSCPSYLTNLISYTAADPGRSRLS